MNIKGNWRGCIIYGKGYRKMQGASLFFRVTFQQEGEQISGIAFDTEGVGKSPDKASIKGKISDESIAFEKQYERMHSANRKGELVFLNSKPPVIHYQGRFIEEQDQFEGTWSMSVKMYLFGVFPISSKLSGIWRMWQNRNQDNL